MRIGTIYTLYGRRAGAELCLEKTLESVYQAKPDLEWIVFCNREASRVLERDFPYVQAVYVPFLDNQYKKAFWLECLSSRQVNRCRLDCFWIPSGCNHFPGHWNVPVLTTFHDFGEYHIPHKYSFARMVFRKRICIPRSIQRSALFTTVSRFTADDMKRILHVDERRIRVIYNGTSPYASTGLQPDSSLLQKWGLNPGCYLFTPGRTDYIGKGLDLLLAAFRRLHAENPSLRLVLVGPAGEGHSALLEDLALDGQAGGSVMYLGRVEDKELLTLYSFCKATVLASRFEGFGFPVLEAMAYRVPVVCSDAGALPEVAGDGAVLFRSGDVNSLADAISKVCSLTDVEKASMIVRGQGRLQLFSWSESARQMLSAFDAIR